MGSDGEVLEVRHNDIVRLELLFVAGFEGAAVASLALEVALLALQLLDLFLGLGREPLLRGGKHESWEGKAHFSVVTTSTNK